MAIYLKVCRKKKAKQSANLHQVFKDEEMNKNNAQRSMRYIGFSFGQYNLTLIEFPFPELEFYFTLQVYR